MADLVQLSSSSHSDLKLKPGCTLEVAKSQHLINIRVTEVGKAACDFPIFLSRTTTNGEWAMSAITSLQVESNLFLKDGEWDATYTPNSMQTYPFFLMHSPEDETRYTVGIDESNEAFSREEGEALFDEKGQASLHLSQVTGMLEEDFKNGIQTFKFIEKLEQMGLLQSIDVRVVYEDGEVFTLKGLHTVFEGKLQELSTEELDQLRSTGYLAAIYALLVSINQLNGLIRRHNALEGSRRIVQVKMEVTPSAA